MKTTTPKYVDYLIVGQGLAGTCFALEALSNNQRVHIIDLNNAYSASRLAAGIVNPIKGKRLYRLWQDDATFDWVKHWYEKTEQRLSISVIKTRSLIRCLNTETECEAYLKKKDHPDYRHFLKEKPTPLDDTSFFHTPKDVFKLSSVLQLNTKHFLESAKRYFQKQNSYSHAYLNYSDIHEDASGIRWKGILGKTLVFCDGHHAQYNPFCSFLNFEHAMGHIIELESSHIKSDSIINNGQWLYRKHANTFHFGTTSYWERCPKNRRQSIKTLEKHLANFLTVPYQIKHYFHGTRPVLKDRKPFVGIHPDNTRIGIINGFGGHGVYHAPLCAKQFLTLNNSLITHPF